MNAIWKVEKIPILQDNFIFVLHSQGQAWIIDPGDAPPVLDFLVKEGLKCAGILVTHHHHDHVDGIDEIVKAHACPVYAPTKNKGQIPKVTNYLNEGDVLKFLDLEIEVLELPGHTMGHIAFWIPTKKWLFSGDVVFALGCGRLFEGTFKQMFEALQRIKDLPPETLIFCTHDYFPANSEFCASQNIQIQDYDSIHPLLLSQEIEFNPFLKSPTLEEFTANRKARNSF